MKALTRQFLSELKAYGYMVAVYSGRYKDLFKISEEATATPELVSDLAQEVDRLTLTTFSALTQVRDDSQKTRWEVNFSSNQITLGLLYKIVEPTEDFKEISGNHVVSTNTGIAVHRDIADALLKLLNSQT